MTTRVLVVEDDPDVSSLLLTVLRDEGYDVGVARNGLQGLAQLRFGSFDLALLDIMMPELDGLHVLRQLLEEGDGSLLKPVIVVTGSETHAALVREVLPPEDVMLKPFDAALLLARVAHHLDAKDDA